MRLFPRRFEKPLFDLFGDIAQLLESGAESLARTLGENPREREGTAAELHEQSADAVALSRRIANRLAAALITPFEAEILHTLALCMSDALDAMERSADLTVRFDLGSVPPALLETAELISRAAELTVEATWHLSDTDELREFSSAMRRLDTHAERLLRGVLTDLYASAEPAGEMLRIREVAFELRHVLERFEQVARTADLLRIKDS